MTLELYRLTPAGNLYIRKPDWTWLRSDVAALVRGAALQTGAAVMVLDGSKEGGGKFKDHKSHRAGADLDLRGLLPGKPGDDPQVLAFLQALAPALEKIGSTYPLDVTGVKVRAWPGHTGHVHARFPVRTVSGRVLGAAAKLRSSPRSGGLVAELVKSAKVALLAIEGHDPPGASQVAKAVSLAWLTKATADPVTAALNGPETAAAIRSLALFLGDFDTSTVAVATEPWLHLDPTEAVTEAADIALKGFLGAVGFGAAALAPLLVPALASALVLAVAVGAVFYAVSRAPKKPDKSAPDPQKRNKSASPPANVEELTFAEIRSLHTKFVSPVGRRDRASLVKSLAASGVTEENVKTWMRR